MLVTRSRIDDKQPAARSSLVARVGARYNGHDDRTGSGKLVAGDEREQ
jgi:hypothetical protein